MEHQHTPRLHANRTIVVQRVVHDHPIENEDGKGSRWKEVTRDLGTSTGNTLVIELLRPIIVSVAMASGMHHVVEHTLIAIYIGGGAGVAYITHRVWFRHVLRRWRKEREEVKVALHHADPLDWFDHHNH